jgi:hypothetical protein
VGRGPLERSGRGVGVGRPLDRQRQGESGDAERGLGGVVVDDALTEEASQRGVVTVIPRAQAIGAGLDGLLAGVPPQVPHQFGARGFLGRSVHVQDTAAQLGQDRVESGQR